MVDKERIFICLGGFVLVFSLFFVFASHVIQTYDSETSFNISLNTNYQFNISVNNSDAGEVANITMVNITIPSSCTFTEDSNATDSESDTFVNTSNVLSWTNSTGYVVNGSEEMHFWFNATCDTAGTYDIQVNTTNATSTYETNLTLNVIDWNISSCEPINYSGSYTLNQSINSSGTCLTIQASDIIIDCQGNSINFSESTANKYGIYSSGNTNITIKNCIINQVNLSTQAKAGVYLIGATNSTVYNNSIYLINGSNTVAYPGYFQSSLNLNISKNIFNISYSPDLSFGLYLFNHCNDSIIEENNITVYAYNLSVGLILGAGNGGSPVYRTNVSGNRIIAYSGTSGGLASSVTGTDNRYYNNYFSSSSSSYAGFSSAVPWYGYNNNSNHLNTTNTTATNIIGRAYMGGNYWTNPTGNGYSDTCTNLDNDYFCDTANTLDSNNIDYLPLTNHINTTASLSSSSSSSSSSSGGYSPQWKMSYIIGGDEFEQGYSRQIGLKERFRFKIGDETDYHYVGVLELNSNSVKMEIASDPQEATLLIGDERRFDVNSDNYYDIYVKLNGINETKADLMIKEIYEKVTEESGTVEQEEENFADEGIEVDKEGKDYLWVLIIVLIVISVGFGIKNKDYFSKK